MSDLSPAERRLRKQIAANTRWANVINRAAETRTAREAADARFEKLVDPNGQMTPKDRKAAAQNARRLFYQGIAVKSLEARRRNRGVA